MIVCSILITIALNLSDLESVDCSGNASPQNSMNGSSSTANCNNTAAFINDPSFEKVCKGEEIPSNGAGIFAIFWIFPGFFRLRIRFFRFRDRFFQKKAFPVQVSKVPDSVFTGSGTCSFKKLFFFSKKRLFPVLGPVFIKKGFFRFRDRFFSKKVFSFRFYILLDFTFFTATIYWNLRISTGIFAIRFRDLFFSKKKVSSGSGTGFLKKGFFSGSGSGSVFIFCWISLFSLQKLYRNLTISTGIFAIIGTLTFVVFFALGPGSIPWLITGELFTQAPRSAAIAIATFVNWTGNLIVGLVFPQMQERITNFSFLPFTVALVLLFVALFYYLPETKGIPVSEIEALFQVILLIIIIYNIINDGMSIALGTRSTFLRNGTGTHSYF